MLRGTSKLVMSLSPPLSLPLLSLRLFASRVTLSLSPSPLSLSSSSSSPSNPRSKLGLGFLLRVSNQQQVHTHSESSSSKSTLSLAWPEWSNLLQFLRAAGHFERHTPNLGDPADDDPFPSHDLPPEFLRAAYAFLSFARKRSDLLSSLSRKDMEIVVENGSAYLFKNGRSSERRLRAFLGRSDNDVLESERAQTIDLARFLLSYACDHLVASDKSNFSNRDFVEMSVRNLLSELVNVSQVVRESGSTENAPEQFLDRFGQSPGRFSQNIEMKRGDWICPKCSFMNFARNMKCLECNEARPKRQLTGGEWECPQCDFFNYGRNAVCLRCDCKRPWGNPYSAADPESNMAYKSSSEKGNSFLIGNTGGSTSNNSSETSIRDGLDRILGRSTTTSRTDDNVSGKAYNQSDSVTYQKFTSSRWSQSLGNDCSSSSHVPFVPLPADRFRKHENPATEEPVSKTSGNHDEAPPHSVSNDFIAGKPGDASLTPEPKNPAQSDWQKEQAEKSERWYKKVSELHDATDLASAISDEDFPEIMPMRKGENRFVVSKKKDRSLTSPQYKRRLAMEQTNSSSFVPFVPFPPGYFAKKDNQPVGGAPAENTPETLAPEKLPDRHEKSGGSNLGTETHWASSSGNQPSNKGHISASGTNENKLDGVGSSGFSGMGDRGRNLNQQSENVQKDQFAGKSLEGSLVTEPDPLDMSEEAKAQRWFRRVAQIKDISELSQIPDEDFPSIMPMRKGVNRFVVSKRKTPMERRLTSPQYRKNLPIISSEPTEKKDSSSREN